MTNTTEIPQKKITLVQPQPSLAVDRKKYDQLRVAAYCRVSTDSEEQLTSYKMQKKVYTEMIQEKKEWCLAGIYADEGISGTRADKRTEFQRLMKDCLNKYSYLNSLDRSFLKRLIEGTIERVITVDHVIGQFSKVPVKKMKKRLKRQD